MKLDFQMKISLSNLGFQFRRFAFTLVELLVVIALIAILAGLLLTALARAKASALVIACMNHERQMGIALNMYVGDNQAYPFWVRVNVNNPEAPSYHWEQALQIYYPLTWTSQAYHCPAYLGVIATTSTSGGYSGSYAYNYHGADNIDDFEYSGIVLGLGFLNDYSGGDKLEYNPISESAVKTPSGMLAISDARIRTTGGFHSINEGEDYMTCSMGTASLGTMISDLEQAPPQHGQNFNALFCDGHVEAIKVSDLFNPTNTAVYWNNDHQPHPELW